MREIIESIKHEPLEWLKDMSAVLCIAALVVAGIVVTPSADEVIAEAKQEYQF